MTEKPIPTGGAPVAKILRNSYYANACRRRRRVVEVDLPDGDYSPLVGDPDSRDPEGDFFAAERPTT